MKNIALFLGLVFLVSTQAMAQVDAAQPAEEEVSGPVMTFETTTVQYGEIEQGADPLRTVNFTNTGTEPLVINSAKGSCGCTVPNYPKEPIMPGQTSVIEVRYDTKRVGPINKTVKIKTNEGANVQHVLYVKGKISKVVQEEAVPESESSMFAPSK